MSQKGLRHIEIYDLIETNSIVESLVGPNSLRGSSVFSG